MAVLNLTELNYSNFPGGGINNNCMEWCKEAASAFYTNEEIKNYFLLIMAGFFVLYQIAFPVIYALIEDETAKDILFRLYKNVPFAAFFLIMAFIVITK